MGGRWVGGISMLAAALAIAWPAAAGASEEDPPFSVSQEELDASLDCPAFAHPDREPVLLVHGTGTHGHEQYDWNHLLVLPGLGFDVCVVTYPDRGLGDQQVSAEYVAHAVLAIHAATGRQVDLVGHSQGASMPRWAVKFWPSVRAAIDDYVGIAGPYHGSASGGGRSDAGSLGVGMPEAFFQFAADSRFTTILNTGDETPGAIDWTNLYTRFDVVVQPVEPVPTSALDFGQDNPRVRNILLQDLCPGRVVDHVTIGTTDRLAFDLMVDALSHDGPAEPDRLDLTPACSVAEQIVDAPGQGQAFADLFFQGVSRGLPDWHLATEEPPTKPYAQSDRDEGPGPAQEEPAAGSSAPVAAVTDAPAVARALPATGGGAAIAAVAVAVLAAFTRGRPGGGGTGRR